MFDDTEAHEKTASQRKLAEVEADELRTVVGGTGVGYDVNSRLLDRLSRG